VESGFIVIFMTLSRLRRRDFGIHIKAYQEAFERFRKVDKHVITRVDAFGILAVPVRHLVAMRNVLDLEGSEAHADEVELH
jgi:hypothetical protein